MQSLTEQSSVPEEISDRLTPQQQAQRTLAILEADVDLLERKKSDLIHQVSALAEGIADTKKHLGVDIAELKAEKKHLLAEVSDLGELIVTLGANRNAFVAGYEHFGDERVGAVDKVARLVSARLGERSALLSRKASDIAGSEKFAQEFCDYLYLLAEILQGQSESLISQRQGLDTRAVILAKSEESCRKSSLIAGRKVDESHAMHKEASAGLKEARRLRLEAQKVLDSAKLRISRSNADLLLREKKVVAGFKFIDKTKIALQKEKLRLLDKEATLQRTVARLRASGAII